MRLISCHNFCAGFILTTYSHKTDCYASNMFYLFLKKDTILLPAKLISSTVLENVWILVIVRVTIISWLVLICISGIAIHQFALCYTAGTKALWVVAIDIYAMVADIALPLQVTWNGVYISLLTLTETLQVKGLLLSIHSPTLDSTPSRMFTESVFRSKETRMKPELQFGRMIVIL